MRGPCEVCGRLAQTLDDDAPLQCRDHMQRTPGEQLYHDELHGLEMESPRYYQLTAHVRASYEARALAHGTADARRSVELVSLPDLCRNMVAGWRNHAAVLEGLPAGSPGDARRAAFLDCASQLEALVSRR